MESYKERNKVPSPSGKHNVCMIEYFFVPSCIGCYYKYISETSCKVNRIVIHKVIFIKEINSEQ